MLNIKVGWYWKICWGFIVPVGLMAILFYSLITSEQVKHNGVDFPPAAIGKTWFNSWNRFGSYENSLQLVALDFS
jgi:solute carrier family 6 amino acid transporter-like protein 5/7/9/14